MFAFSFDDGCWIRKDEERKSRISVSGKRQQQLLRLTSIDPPPPLIHCSHRTNDDDDSDKQTRRQHHHHHDCHRLIQCLCPEGTSAARFRCLMAEPNPPSSVPSAGTMDAGQSSKKQVLANGSVPAGIGLTNGSLTASHSASSPSSPPSESSSHHSADQPNGTSASDIFDLGFELTELYKHALKFYKGMI